MTAILKLNNVCVRFRVKSTMGALFDRTSPVSFDAVRDASLS